MYPKRVLKLFFEPQHVYAADVLLHPGYTLTTSTATSNDGAEQVQLFLQLDADAGVIVAARFLARGSVVLIAGAESVCAQIEGKSLQDVKQALTSEAMLLDLELSPIYKPSVLLVLRALSGVA